MTTVPKTGQTACYNSNSATISCIGTGQDGELQAGVDWPIPRFVDNGDQTIVDKLTGLVWSKDGNPAAAKKNWQEALDYIKNLNRNNYLGYNDWRLPNVTEMGSLINKGYINPPRTNWEPWKSPGTWLDTWFSNVSIEYWTSSTEAEYTYAACYTNLYFGNVYYKEKITAYNVWPVRSGPGGTSQLYTFSVFLDGNGSGTVTSDSGGFACTSGTCSAQLPGYTAVTLFATPTSNSLFTGWMGDCDGSGNCSFLLSNNKAATAIFTAAPKVRVGSKHYSLLQPAYNDATTADGSVIQLLEGSITGNFIANRNIKVKLAGGYCANFGAICTETTLQSPLLIRGGAVRAKGVNIR